MPLTQQLQTEGPGGPLLGFGALLGWLRELGDTWASLTATSLHKNVWERTQTSSHVHGPPPCLGATSQHRHVLQNPKSPEPYSSGFHGGFVIWARRTVIKLWTLPSQRTGRGDGAKSSELAFLSWPLA